MFKVMKFSVIRFPFLRFSPLIFTGFLFCLSAVHQNTFGQSPPASSPAPKEVAHRKDPLSLDNIFKALRSEKATMAQKNQLLIKGVKERGISFALTAELEEELNEQGANKNLIEAISRESEELLKMPYYYRERADDFRLRKSYAEAIANYNKTIEINSEDRVAYNNRGHVYQELKKYDEALADFSRVIELDPTDRNGYNNRGVIYYLQNEFQKAIEDFTRAVEIDPNFAEAYTNRANAFQMMGQLKSAENDRRQAARIKQ